MSLLSKHLSIIICNLNTNKPVCKNSTPKRILQLSKFNSISFSTGMFSSVLEIAQVIPLYKTNSKSLTALATMQYHFAKH